VAAGGSRQAGSNAAELGNVKENPGRQNGGGGGRTRTAETAGNGIAAGIRCRQR